MLKEKKVKEYNLSKAKQGPVVPPKTNKTRITIRLDSKLIDWFRTQVNKAHGGSYQTLINEALREYIQYHENESLEDTIRRVLREELHQDSQVFGVNS